MTRLAYLHGFASGPGSTKAQFFKARFAERGVTLEIPDLAPDFTSMTVASMLVIVDAIRELPLSIAFIDRARDYEAEPDPLCPTLVLHGRRDDAVPIAAGEAFAARRPDRRRLIAYDAGHELTEVLEEMWEECGVFLRA